MTAALAVVGADMIVAADAADCSAHHPTGGGHLAQVIVVAAGKAGSSRLDEGWRTCDGRPASALPAQVPHVQAKHQG